MLPDDSVQSNGHQAGLSWCRRAASQDILDLDQFLDKHDCNKNPITTYKEIASHPFLTVVGSLQMADEVPPDMQDNEEFWMGFVEAVEHFGEMIATHNLWWESN